MPSAFHFLATVLIWGSSWLAIKYQLGVVPVEVSLVYRFGLASVALIAFCLLSGRSLRFSPAQHRFIALQGIMLFGVNYLTFYIATPFLTTGLVAVIFSTIIFFNILFAAVFFGHPVRPRVVLGAAVGIAGIALIFRPEIAGSDLASGTMAGVGISLLATALSSLGNMVAVRNQNAGLPIIATNALGMAYGAAAMAILAFVRGLPFNFDPAPLYVGSLGFLAILASAVAFWTYLSLIRRVGPDRGAYAVVALPVVALALSTVFEGFVWTGEAMAGVGLVLAGSVLVLRRADGAPKAASAIAD